MALPKAVQAQADLADEIIKKIGDPTEPAANVETQTEVQQPEIVAAPPQPPTPVAPTAPAEPNWKHKFETLQGKYNAEVPRLNSQLVDLTSQVAKLAAEKILPPAPPTPPAPVVTDKDRETFGPDLVEMIERVSRTATAPLESTIRELQAENAKLKGSVGEVTQHQTLTAKDIFERKLDGMCPDWQALNVDAGFIAWLQGVDPIYGLPRQEALNVAANNGDAQRTAVIFNAYKATLTPAPEQLTPEQELQNQVAPARTRSSVPPAGNPSDTKIFTQDEITRFYDAYRRGHISGPEAEATEKAIHAAVTEGRIR